MGTSDVRELQASGSKPQPRTQAKPAGSVKVKVLALLGLSAVQVFAGIVFKLAQSGGKYAFSPQGSLVMSETVKLVMSVFYLVQDSGSSRIARSSFMAESSPKLLFHMCSLASLYAFNNSLAFWIFARADPGSIMLTKATSAIVSAILLYFVRGFVLSPTRWLILATQVLGLMTAQYDSCKGSPLYGFHIYAIMLLTLVNSNVANVWNEFVIQKFPSASLATKNIYLYAFGMALNIVLFGYNRWTVPESPSFFQGYSPAAMAVVTSNALIGISMNLVYKYADALVKTIASSLTAVVLLIISALLFGGRSDLMVFVGGGVLLIGTYLYFAVGVIESRLAEVEAEEAKLSESFDDKKREDESEASTAIIFDAGNHSEANKT